MQLTCAVALVLALGGSRSGNAVSVSRVAVLPVRSGSSLPDSIRMRLRGTIEQGLRRGDVEIVSDATVDGELGAVTCDGARCIAALAQAVAAAWIVRPTITMTDSVYEVRLEALDGRGRAIASARERCEICGEGEVTELVVDRSAALAAKVRLLQRRAPRLTLRSRPSGAEVFVDERLVGHTPLEHEVDVGDHEVRLELPGYASERRHVTALAGTQDALSFTLLSDRGARGARGPWLGLGVASLGVGTGMLGAGVGLIAIDEREYERRCNPDPLGHCSHRYDTLAGGVALAVGGGALLAAGVAALVVDRRGRRAGPRRSARRRAGHGLALAF